MTLDELLSELEDIPREEIPDAIATLAGIGARLQLRLTIPEPVPEPELPDEYLSPDEAAELAGVDRAWLIRATRGKPFRHQPSTKTIRFAKRGFLDWLTSRVD